MAQEKIITINNNLWMHKSSDIPFHNMVGFSQKLHCYCLTLDRSGDIALTNNAKILVTYQNKSLIFTQATCLSQVRSSSPPLLLFQNSGSSCHYHLKNTATPTLRKFWKVTQQQVKSLRCN